ncbi:type II toxin-antitoxin system prevent-host-death family antitoxin (plasmid) [Deinococcus sp. KNUC1210]|uniref:type II toxin-antitoxin system prevent-host-death family antitoxin n=1 Tax=Deinococcus sp. KNUC1210 TaxID=2917691 RepID=UPI001EF09A31|nr:type II toxin-antitoxin system prevent-host-death family antitoxin [Deinococcus sp. KNUC1210]ULH16952.1 type II toxin-antitoxin system prevent-host-death family antitoxin [Deinococcus sp. KNUC1210]
MPAPGSISISDLRRQLHQVLGHVESGQTVTILHHGQPVAALTPSSAAAHASASMGASQLRDTLHRTLRSVQFEQMSYLICQHHRPVAALVPASLSSFGALGDSMSPSIIALVSLKGGVGKTTSTMHLASVAALKDHPVTVLDGDSEHSALHWAELAASVQALPYDVQVCEERGVITQAKQLRENGHVVIIDTPPNDRTLLLKAAGIADHILVPVAPTGIDLDRLRGTLQLLADAQAISGRELDIGILLVRFTARKALAQEAETVLREFPILETRIRALKAYEESFGSAPAYLDEYERVWTELTA